MGTINNATVSNTVAFGTIDPKYAPKQNLVFNVALSSSTSGGYGNILVSPSGNLYLCYVSTGVTYANLNGIQWTIGE